MLLYEGLHDRNVKHFYSDGVVKQRITHLRAVRNVSSLTTTTDMIFSSCHFMALCYGLLNVLLLLCSSMELVKRPNR